MARSQHDQELAAAIGEMTMMWNDCQSIIFMIFEMVLGLPILKAKALFFSLKSDASQRDIALALIRCSLPRNLADRASSAIADLGVIAGKRNDFIHAVWHYPEDQSRPLVWLNTKRRLANKDAVKACHDLMNELGASRLSLWALHEEVEAGLKLPKNALAQGLGAAQLPLQSAQAPSHPVHSKPDDQAIPPKRHESSEE